MGFFRIKVRVRSRVMFRIKVMWIFFRVRVMFRVRIKVISVLVLVRFRVRVGSRS